MAFGRTDAAAAALAAAWLLLAARLPAAAGGSGAGGGDEMVTGEVVSARSRWARGKTAIVTESVLRTPAGREVMVRQLGGSVDGIGMVTLHGQPILRAGDRVTARIGRARDLRGRVSRPVRALYAPGGGGGPGGRVPFVRTLTGRTRVPIYWQSGCALISLHEAGTSDIEGDREFEEIERVLDRWTSDVQDCSYFELRSEGRTTGDVGLDGINLVLFRDDEWCVPATDEEPADCHDPAAAGLTTINYVDDPQSDRMGAILDADIELNAVYFSVAVDHQSNEPGLCESDLANTFTHELGHLMGLDHTCWSGVGERLEDHSGEPIPLCSLEPNLPPPVRDATMFAFQDCAETKKASPEPDDIDGVCTMYPLDDDPGECRPADLHPASSCAAAGASGGPGAAALVALAWFLARRRRRSCWARADTNRRA